MKIREPMPPKEFFDIISDGESFKGMLIKTPYCGILEVSKETFSDGDFWQYRAVSKKTYNTLFRSKNPQVMTEWYEKAIYSIEKVLEVL
jgi:hypothetical protein